MSKSMLVIDTPERCIDCEIGQNHSNILETCVSCPVAGKWAIDKEVESIPDWCPLKPLPEKMAGVVLTEHWGGVKKGWNACIDAITGGNADD